MNNVATYSGNENNNPNQQVIIKKKTAVRHTPTQGEAMKNM